MMMMMIKPKKRLSQDFKHFRIRSTGVWVCTMRRDLEREFKGERQIELFFLKKNVIMMMMMMMMMMMVKNAFYIIST